jgi:hypothetical protein
MGVVTVKNEFRLKASDGGLIEIKANPQFDDVGMSKTFYTPDSDGDKFKEFLKNIKEGDEIIITFKSNIEEVIEERLKKLIDEHIEELLEGLV